MEGASVEELNQKIGTLEKEKNKEEEYRNYMQLERVRFAALFALCYPFGGLNIIQGHAALGSPFGLTRGGHACSTAG